VQARADLILSISMRKCLLTLWRVRWNDEIVVGCKPQRKRFFSDSPQRPAIHSHPTHLYGRIWQVGQKYSKTWRFSDINYAASSLDDRRSIFRSYGAVLNSLPTDATAKITIINRRLNPVDFQRTMLMPECSDGLDYYRGEYNQIILDKAAESNNLVQEKYITLSIGLRKIEQTRAYFRRVDTNLSASFGRLDSGAYAISCADRLRLLHDFFRPGEEASFRFDLSANIKRGIDFRDLICPDGLQFRAGYFEMGGKFGRVLFMRDDSQLYQRRNDKRPVRLLPKSAAVH